MSSPAAPQKAGPPAAWLAVKPFLNGGLAGMAATSIIQPIDMVKVRIQLGATGGPVSWALTLSHFVNQFGAFKSCHLLNHTLYCYHTAYI